jgi:hypothetical protein
MRTSSFSDDRVIRLVSTYFVPVHVSRDCYLQEKPDFATQAELNRIDTERKAKKMEGGAVAIYILQPDGTVLTTIPVQQAYFPDKFLDFLERVVRENKFEPRRPEDVRKTTAEAAPPRRTATTDGLLLTVWTRGEDNKGKGTTTIDFLDLSAEEWRTLTPPDDAKVGATWTVPERIADRLLILCYPPGPHWNTRENKLTARSLNATLTAIEGEENVIRLTGKVEMIQPFTGKPDDTRLTVRLVGYVRQDRSKKTITDINLASDEAIRQSYYQSKPLPRTTFHVGIGRTQ